MKNISYLEQFLGRKQRSGIDIIADMLDAAGEGAKRTRIMYVTNLSYKLLKKYLKKVMDANLLEKKGNNYNITEKGELFLEKYDSYSEKKEALKKKVKELYADGIMLLKMCQLD